MKTRTLLLFLFLLSFVNGVATTQELGKNITLKKNATSDERLRSASLLASAYLDISRESLLLNLENYSNDVIISVTNLSTNEIVYSGLHAASNNIVLDMAGLLKEGSEYRLEITIGETILYGDFNL